MRLITSRRLAGATLGLAIAIVPVAAWSADSGADPAPVDHQPALCGGGDQFGEPFARTELFFGLSRPNGKPIRDREFKKFVDAEVTPRFPDGLTVLEADGQFKDSTGESPQSYLQRLRLEAGKALLANSKLRLDQILDRIGYHDDSAFRRLFKRYTSLSPREYRQRFGRT